MHPHVGAPNRDTRDNLLFLVAPSQLLLAVAVSQAWLAFADQGSLKCPVVCFVGLSFCCSLSAGFLMSRRDYGLCMLGAISCGLFNEDALKVRLGQQCDSPRHGVAVLG